MHNDRGGQDERDPNAPTRSGQNTLQDDLRRLLREFENVTKERIEAARTGDVAAAKELIEEAALKLRLDHRDEPLMDWLANCLEEMEAGTPADEAFGLTRLDNPGGRPRKHEYHKLTAMYVLLHDREGCSVKETFEKIEESANVDQSTIKRARAVLLNQYMALPSSTLAKLAKHYIAELDSEMVNRWLKDETPP